MSHRLIERLELWAGHPAVPWVLALSFLALHLIGLDSSPMVYWDETANTSAARELAFFGRFAAPALSGTMYLDTHFFIYPPVYPLMLTAIYKLFGFGIWQSRIPSVILGALSIATVYWASRRLTGSALVGLVAGALLWGDSLWTLASRLARTDVLAMTFVMGSLLVLLHARKTGSHFPRQHLLVGASGVLGGLAVLTGPRAVFPAMGVGLSVLAMQEFGELRRRLQMGACFLSGAILPAIGWLAYIISAPEAFRVQFIPHAFGATPLTQSRWYFGDTLSENLRIFFVAYPVIIGGLIFAFSPLSLRSPSGLILPVMFLPCLPLLLPPVPAVYVLPLFAISAASLIVYILRRISLTKPLLSFILICCVATALLIAPLGRLSTALLQRESRSDAYLQRALKSHLTPPCTVAGDPLVYFAILGMGCDFRLFRFGLILSQPDETIRWEEYKRALADWKPDYLVLKEGTAIDEIFPPGTALHYSETGVLKLGRPRPRLWELLSQGQGTIVLVVYRRQGE